METRKYQLPNTNVSKRMVNRVVAVVECSIGEYCTNAARDTMQVTITCKEEDIPVVQKILHTTGTLKSKGE